MKTKIIELKDGAKLFYTPDKSIRGIHIDLGFRAGSINDPKGKLGVAHFCEHAFAGDFSTDKFTSEELVKRRHNFNYANASTNPWYVRFYAATTLADIETAFDFLTHPYKHILYNEENFERSKKVIASEIQTVTSTKNNRIINKIFNTEIAKDKNLHRLIASPAGTLESLDNITIKDLQNHVKNYFTLNNLTISVGGGIKLSLVKKLIEKYIYPNIPTSNHQGLDYYDIVGLNKPSYHFDKSVEKNTAVVRFIFPAEDLGHKVTLEERDLYRLTSTVMSEKAFNFFRTQKNLCYGCGASVGEEYRILDAIVDIKCSDDNIKKVLDAAVEFIQNSDEDVEEKAFETHKKRALAGFNFQARSLMDITLAPYDYYHNYEVQYGPKLIKRKEKSLKNVKYEDVNALSKRILLNKPHLTILSNDEKWKKFDYEKYCKKLMKK